MTKTRILLLAATLAAWPSSSAHAAVGKEAEKEARRAFQEAEGHFRAGEFAEALRAYEDGYARAPLPGFLINIAQCHRRLGDLTRARATYQKFVMVAPDSPHVPEVNNLIAELDKLIAELEKPPAAVTPPAAGGLAATDAPANAPALSPPPVAPAPSPSPPAGTNLLAQSPSGDPAAAEPTSHKTRWWLWGLAGAAVLVAGGTAAAFALGDSTNTVHQGSLGALRR